MKEVIARTFVVEAKEVIQRLGLPEGDLIGAELAPDGSAMNITVAGEKK